MGAIRTEADVPPGFWLSPCSVVSAGTAPECRVRREPCTLQLCLPAFRNLGRGAVTREPEYFWQVSNLCVLQWIFFFILPSQAPERSGHASCLLCSLPVLSLSCPAEAEGHLFHPYGCIWRALAVLETMQGWEASTPCRAVADSSLPPADTECERWWGRPVWFPAGSKGSLWQTLKPLALLKKTVWKKFTAHVNWYHILNKHTALSFHISKAPSCNINPFYYSAALCYWCQQSWEMK